MLRSPTQDWAALLQICWMLRALLAVQQSALEERLNQVSGKGCTV